MLILTCSILKKSLSLKKNPKKPKTNKQKKKPPKNPKKSKSQTAQGTENETRSAEKVKYSAVYIWFITTAGK